MTSRGCRWFVAATMACILLAPTRGFGEEREHFQLKLGAFYDQGDFGTSSTTRTFLTPVTLKYLGDRFDLGVTSSFLVVDTPGNVALIEGVPTRKETRETRRVTGAGVGDTILKGRLFLFEDPGTASLLPAVTPFAKLKIPTADEDRNLGTGEVDYGFGIELDKSLGRFFVFGNAGYTVIGSPAGQDFRNRPAGSVGAGVEISKAVAVSALVDWRRAIVNGRDDPVELVGLLTYKFTRALSLTPAVSVGLTNGAPDFSVGAELAYKFGRY